MRPTRIDLTVRDVLLPLLIVAACGGIVALVSVLTRPKPSRSDLVIPEPVSVPATPTPPPGPTGGGAPLRVALADWHLEYGDTLLDRIDTADQLVDPTTESAAVEDPDAMAATFAEATAAHPAPEMRAELAAMQAAIEALGHARSSGDGEAAERHRATYLGYRSRWLERLWQFPADSGRVTMLRQRGLAERVAATGADTGASDGPAAFGTTAAGTPDAGPGTGASDEPASAEATAADPAAESGDGSGGGDPGTTDPGGRLLA